MKLPSAAEAIRFLSLVIFFSLPFLPGGYAVVDAETGGECLDRAEQCVFWAATGECTKNRTWMHENCKKSCDRCNVVRVSGTEEMNNFIAKKKKELAEKRAANQRAQAVLEGKISSDEL